MCECFWCGCEHACVMLSTHSVVDTLCFNFGTSSKQAKTVCCTRVLSKYLFTRTTVLSTRASHLSFPIQLSPWSCDQEGSVLLAHLSTAGRTSSPLRPGNSAGCLSFCHRCFPPCFSGVEPSLHLASYGGCRVGLDLPLPHLKEMTIS